MEQERATIAFAVPNYGPLWAPVVSSWLRVVAYTSRYFETHQIGKLGGAGITDRAYTMTAENRCVEEFLAYRDAVDGPPRFTHLFFTESDMILPHDCITKLLALDKDMASGVYFLRSDNPATRGQPCLYKRPPGRLQSDQNEYGHLPVSLFPQQQPFQVDVAGLGCVLIRREVFESVSKPWFDLHASDTGIGYGSDMYFYTNARKHGFQLWCDPTVTCGQIDYYTTDLNDYKWRLDNDPEFAKSGYIIGMGGHEPKIT